MALEKILGIGYCLAFSVALIGNPSPVVAAGELERQDAVDFR